MGWGPANTTHDDTSQVTNNLATTIAPFPTFSPPSLMNYPQIGKLPILTYPIVKALLGSFPFKVFKSRTWFLKFVSIDSDSHRPQILIILVTFHQLSEKFLQICQGGDTVGPASRYQSMIGNCFWFFYRNDPWLRASSPPSRRHSPYGVFLPGHHVQTASA